PHDNNIIQEVKKISSIDEVKYNGPDKNITLIGNEIDDIYLSKIYELSLSPEAIRENSGMKMVYTPIHGTGVELVPKVLKKFGFTDVINVPEQDVVDGNFPTVISPNPEESAALKMALEKANQTGAELVMATDPDADRVGIAVRDLSNEFIILNGNQTGSLLVYYLLTRWAELGLLKGKEYVCKTIVTSELIADISNKFGVEYFDVLTGFKFIADIIKRNEGNKKFIGGGEESYGYLAGEFVRDKDAVMSCALIAETAAWARSKGKSLYELLIDIYVEFDYYKEALENVVRKGKSGAEEIQEMMNGFRNNPPKSLGNSKITRIHDYLSQESFDPQTGKKTYLTLPRSNVLQFFLKDGSKISVRPSGTEPKIKFYMSVKEPLLNKEDFSKVGKELDGKILAIKKDLGIR
ncbi:MAG: phospho-sugar mutase, partial [Bacteroidota bacterium]|nr:phospho-sugar mutase [Bacteroidota bacterium]